jgi:hypothetical protein
LNSASFSARNQARVSASAGFRRSSAKSSAMRRRQSSKARYAGGMPVQECAIPKTGRASPPWVDAQPPSRWPAPLGQARQDFPLAYLAARQPPQRMHQSTLRPPHRGHCLLHGKSSSGEAPQQAARIPPQVPAEVSQQPQGFGQRTSVGSGPCLGAALRNHAAGGRRSVGGATFPRGRASKAPG